ncbi:MAG: FecR family protein [Planctomycetes bacterium]|nr:FecR family protein [Planctomycetota bacterium]
MNDHYTPSPRLCELVDAVCAGALTQADLRELDALLLDDEPARDFYMAYCRMHAELAFRLRSQAAVTAAVLSAPSAKPSRNTSERATQRDSPIFAQQKLGQSSFTFHISALAAVVAFIAIGILAYSFWSSPAVLPVVHHTPAAKIANLTDAKWAGVSSQAGDTLLAGQQLLLQSGSAEITFNNQARVIVSGPAELTIVDAAGCRLATGRLTALVPDAAKGFKVHTLSGTVTDLGTEFGVYVNSGAEDPRAVQEEEQQPGGGPQLDGTQPPVTEVHVFKGQVDITRSEVGSGKSDLIAQTPTSDLRPPTSTILSAGEAVTISENKVQPLPAADPFKFALDKLNGKPRTVLLSEDFESYAVGAQRGNMGPWIVQGSTRKGQGVTLDDFDKGLDEETKIVDDKIPHGRNHPDFNPPPPSISHMLRFVPSAPNPPSTFPRLARAIEAPQLAGTCQVLLEFVITTAHPFLEPSLAFTAEADSTSPGIEFWRNADPAAPRTAWPVSLFYRVRVLIDVVHGIPREARVERSTWRGAKGWIRDTDYRTPVPKVDWSTPPRFVVFGYPMVSPQTPPGIFSIDNIRIEVISEK